MSLFFLSTTALWAVVVGGTGIIPYYAAAYGRQWFHPPLKGGNRATSKPHYA